jgi:putative transposase
MACRSRGSQHSLGSPDDPIAVVTDNGPCFRGVTFADAFAGDDPLFRHVRTR